MTPLKRFFLSSAAVLALSACGGGDAPLPPVQPAQLPLARLWLPILGAPATTLAFDAADSQSPGGEIAHYRFDYGDGAASEDQGQPHGAHIYSGEGVYAVQLTVTDLAGNSATVESEVTVRLDPPVCASDSDCNAGDRCQGICFTEVGSDATGARSLHR